MSWLRIAIIFFVGCINSALFSQDIAYTWAEAAGSDSYETVNKIIVDHDGNFYITGMFGTPEITFGDTTLFNSSSGYEIYLVKYNPSGDVIWACREGGNSGDEGKDIAIDPDNNVIISCSFYSDTIHVGAETFMNAGDMDLLLIKYDSDGNMIWVKDAGGIYLDHQTGITTDSDGNIYTTGMVTSPEITFGDTTLYFPTGDIFLTKYDPDGNIIFAEKFGGIYQDMGLDITSDNENNIYISGYFKSDTIAFDTLTLINAGIWGDIFLVKLDPGGNVIWATSYGGDKDDEAATLGIDSAGNILMTGFFQSDFIDFGGTILNYEDSEYYIAKIDQSGNVIWAKGAVGDALGSSVIGDADGNAILTGGFYSNQLEMDGFELTNSEMSTIYSDIFVVKYDFDGNIIWLKGAHGNKSDFGESIASSGSNTYYIAGAFDSPDLTLDDFELNNTGALDIFLARIGMITGVHDEIPNAGILIYPNPTNDEMNFSVNTLIAPHSSLIITDLAGKIVYQNELIAEETRIDVSDFEPAIYFIHFKSDAFSFTQKFIKQ